MLNMYLYVYSVLSKILTDHIQYYNQVTPAGVNTCVIPCVSQVEIAYD